MKIQRRKFILQSGAAATAIAALPSIAWSNSFLAKTGGGDDIIKKLALLNDREVAGLLERQINKPGARWDGGLVDKYELPNAHVTRDLITVAGIAYASEYSDYYLSPELEKPLERAITCLLNVQYDDGTIDLHSTNFHSTPDTAFIVNDLSPVFTCLKRLKSPGLETLIAKMEKFLTNAGQCFLVGGIHTANHRWVVSSALAWLNSFFPSQKYVDRIDEWLSEGIDLDPDGQYVEKSVGAYSPVCDNMFITLGRLLDRTELLDIVRKNLEMSLYYIQPGGEVVTDASGRQDRAYTAYVDGYYYAYRYFALKDKNPEFASVCNLIENEMPGKIMRFLPNLMEDPVFEQELGSPAKIPEDYFKRFSYSGIFRIRRGTTDITIIENNPTFLSFRKGDAVMQAMRLGASFFGRGQFVSEECEFDGQKILLKRSLTRGYYQPFPIEKRDGSGDWNNMPRDERKLSEAQTLTTIVTITESAGRLSVVADISGTPHVPVTWEVSFRKGGELSGVTDDKNVEDAFFLENGTGQYRHGEDVINFGEGAVTHKWSQMRGMLPKQNGYSVYMTGYTPFKRTLEIY
jgi:hypothetical protein